MSTILTRSDCEATVSKYRSMESAPARRPSVPILNPKNASGAGACAARVAAWPTTARAARTAAPRRRARRTATVGMTLLGRHDSRASGGLFRRGRLAWRGDRVQLCKERRESALLRIEETEFILRGHAAHLLLALWCAGGDGRGRRRLRRLWLARLCFVGLRGTRAGVEASRQLVEVERLRVGVGRLRPR